MYQQVKEMEEDESVDKLDSITLFFTASGKSRRQVARKLKEMGLIQVWLIWTYEIFVAFFEPKQKP